MFVNAETGGAHVYVLMRANRRMPYLCGVFDEATQKIIATAAARFAAHSAFTFQDDRPFHIPLIGSLHVYTENEIADAVDEGARATDQPIEGQFIRWEASAKGKLLVVVALQSHAGLCRVSAKLPRGREWRDLYVEVGSLEAVDRDKWDDFIQAAEAAFPITDASTFTCQTLDYVGVHKPRPRHPSNAKTSTHSGSQPASVRRSHYKLIKNKWVRPRAMSVDGEASIHKKDLQRRPPASKLNQA